MPTLNLELNYFDHIKTRRLRGRLGDNADVLPLRLWCHVGEFRNTDGSLAGYTDSEIEEIIRWKGKAGAAIEALIAVGFLERLSDGGLKVHDWETHSGHLAVFAARAKFAAKARWEKAAPKQDGAEATELEAPGSDRSAATPSIGKCLKHEQALLQASASNAHAVHAEPTKQQGPKPAAPAFVLPDWVDPTAWADYVAMRVKIRKPMTDRAKALAIGDLEKLRAQGHDPKLVLESSILNSWAGVFPLKPGQMQASRPKAPPKPMTAREKAISEGRWDGMTPEQREALIEAEA